MKVDLKDLTTDTFFEIMTEEQIKKYLRYLIKNNPEYLDGRYNIITLKGNHGIPLKYWKSVLKESGFESEYNKDKTRLFTGGESGESNY